jgi:hypothetical protein
MAALEDLALSQTTQSTSCRILVYKHVFMKKRRACSLMDSTLSNKPSLDVCMENMLEYTHGEA